MVVMECKWCRKLTEQTEYRQPLGNCIVYRYALGFRCTECRTVWLSCAKHKTYTSLKYPTKGCTCVDEEELWALKCR